MKIVRFRYTNSYYLVVYSSRSKVFLIGLSKNIFFEEEGKLLMFTRSKYIKYFSLVSDILC